MPRATPMALAILLICTTIVTSVSAQGNAPGPAPGPTEGPAPALTAAEARCNAAVAAMEYALEQFSNDTSPAAAILAQSASAPAVTWPSLYPGFPGLEWATYQATSALGATVFQGSQFGEVQYVMSTFGNKVANISTNGTMEEVFIDAWGNEWWAMADRIMDKVDGTDKVSQASSYLRAATYYFLGQWPFPTSTEGKAASEKSRAAFNQYLNVSGYYYTFFNATFNNGTATAELPAIFITPDPSQKLPVILGVTGTDYDKEAYFQMIGPPALQRGYALIIFDGPGQGPVIRDPPYMPFYNQEDEVVAAVLDAAEADPKVADKMDFSKVVLNGNSLGGYLGGVACANLPAGRLAACVLNPPQYADSSYVNKTSEVFLPFVYLATQPENGGISEKLLPSFASPETAYDTMLSLVQDCGPETPASTLIYDLVSATPGLIDPEITYLAMKYAGSQATTQDGLYAATPAALSAVSTFINPMSNISKTPVPVMALKGNDDDLLGGQEEAFWAALSEEVRDEGQFVTFDSDTGAALHCQAGAYLDSAAPMYPWLESLGIKGIMSSDANNNTNGGGGGANAEESSSSAPDGAPAAGSTDGALGVHSGVVAAAVVAVVGAVLV